MSQFEKYHPLLTQHYVFDWLTKARAIDVFNLYQLDPTTAADMPTTASAINQTMREIFRDQKLIWGVRDRQSDAFIGQAGFNPIDPVAHTATLTVTVFPAYQQAPSLTEIYRHLVAFGTTELHLAHLTVQVTAAPAITGPILKDLGFTTNDQQQYDYQK